MWNLFFCVFLWEIERSHCMIQHTNNTLGSFFSHRAHRVHWAFLRTVSNSQNASGIQISQSVTANEDTNKEAKAAYIQPIGVSRWLLPFPSGEGSGEGPLSFCPLCVLFICVNLWEKVRTLHVRKNAWDSLGRFFSHRTHRSNRTFCVLFWVHKEGVHLLLMLVFNLLRPSLWVLFSVQIH